jgi:alternate signal-mediated exported protein
MRTSEKKGQRMRQALNGSRKTTLILLLCAVLLIGVSLAYLLTRTNTLTNAFTFGKPKIDIEEDFDGWNHKKVKLENVKGPDAVPGVVRAMIIPVLKDKTTGQTTGGAMGPLADPGGGNKVVMGDLTFELASDWAAHWFYKDGYFYYRKVLAPGEQTPNLLLSVYLTVDTPAIREKYVNTDVTVEVFADILQAEGGAPGQAWGVTVSGGIVSYP